MLPDTRFVGRSFALCCCFLLCLLQTCQGQAPPFYTPLQSGVPFVNSTTAGSLLSGFRFQLSSGIKENQDLAFYVQCSNGRPNNYQARCQLTISLRPDMLTSVTYCSGYSTGSLCRLPSCYLPSNNGTVLYMAFSVQSLQGVNTTYNISTTLESNYPTKADSNQPFNAPSTFWSISVQAMYDPFCYWSSVLFSFDPTLMTPQSTLTFTGPTSLNLNVASQPPLLNFYPASAGYGFPYYAVPEVLPKSCQNYLYTIPTAQGFLVAPSAFQQAYAKSQNCTDWYAVYYYCTAMMLDEPPIINGTVGLTAPVQTVIVNASSTTSVELSTDNDLFAFSYLELDTEGMVGDNGELQFVFDYYSGNGQIALLNDSTTQGSSYAGNYFIATQPNTSFEGYFSQSLFNNNRASFVAYYSSPASSGPLQSASFGITLLNQTSQSPLIPVSVFPSAFTYSLDKYNFSVTYELSVNTTSPPSNVSVCLPEWPILLSNTQVNILLYNQELQCNYKNPLPSHQNPYNPYCVYLQSSTCIDSASPLKVIISIDFVPSELEKPIPLMIDFTYWDA